MFSHLHDPDVGDLQKINGIILALFRAGCTYLTKWLTIGLAVDALLAILIFG